jgi:hypothetical protein
LTDDEGRNSSVPRTDLPFRRRTVGRYEARIGESVEKGDEGLLVGVRQRQRVGLR